MKVDKAVDIILKAIALERHEIVVGNWFYWFIPRLTFLSSYVNNVACEIKYKSQLKVMNKAKSQ